MKVMVLGGYGNFGARISRALAGDDRIQLLVAGRDGARAAAFAAALPGGAKGVAVDMHAAGFAKSLQDGDVGLLIHTAGPFQGQDYAVAQACARAGVHYIDLADGRRFVCDFARALHGAFADAGRVAITGASTVPALSSAVVDALCAGWQRLDSIDICIAPAQTAPRGAATLRAVLSYCGGPVQVWSRGQWQTQIGWASPTRVTFQRLRPRTAALCDIPDLELFPAHYQVRQRVDFRAALEVGLSQRAFAVLAWLRRVGVLKNPAGLASVLNASAKLFDPLGSGLGGMVVRVAGLDAAGKAIKRAWHIAADNDHGPEIPCMAAILLARRLASGEPMSNGAFPCVSLHTLADFAPEFAKWGHGDRCGRRGRCMTANDRCWLRMSLVFVWLWTAAVSVWELHGQSRSLLAAGGITDAGVADLLVLSGAALDALLGLWLWLRPSRLVCLLALAAMVLMTLVATWLSPALWLHPLGPLSKNIPIAAVLWVLARRTA